MKTFLLLHEKSSLLPLFPAIGPGAPESICSCISHGFSGVSTGFSGGLLFSFSLCEYRFPAAMATEAETCINSSDFKETDLIIFGCSCLRSRSIEAHICNPCTAKAWSSR